MYIAHAYVYTVKITAGSLMQCNAENGKLMHAEKYVKHEREKETHISCSK